MDSATPDLANLFDENGDICIDVTCRRCAYNLRGLREEGHCPECGTPVGRSTRGDFLQYSDPTWVAKLGRGVHLILWCIGLSIVAYIIAIALAFAFSVPFNIATLVVFAASLVGFWGTWLLTEPDPSQIGEDIYGTARKVVRIGLGVGLFSQVLAYLSETGLPDPLPLIMSIIMIACGLFGIVGEFCRLYYLSKIAQRIPDQKLEKRAAFLKWAMTIGLLFFITVPAIMALFVGTGAAPGGGPGGVLAVLGCVSGVVGLCYLIFLLIYLRMLYRFRTAFREQAALAELLWSGQPLPADPTPENPETPL